MAQNPRSILWLVERLHGTMVQPDHPDAMGYYTCRSPSVQKLGTITVPGRKVVIGVPEILMTWFDIQWGPEFMGYFMRRSTLVQKLTISSLCSERYCLDRNPRCIKM
jgi:hypothetical protein